MKMSMIPLPMRFAPPSLYMHVSKSKAEVNAQLRRGGFKPDLLKFTPTWWLRVAIAWTTGVETTNIETDQFACQWGIVADGTDLGKTFQMAATIMSQDKGDGSRHTVTVTPPQLLPQ